MTTFNIYFDGGMIGNTGDGYGSWEVEWNGFSKKVSREAYKVNPMLVFCTNNIAEYLSLLGALRWLNSVSDKKDYEVNIFGDSQLVLNQITGSFKVKTQHLKKFRDECRTILAEFNRWETKWKKRIHNVQRFGH